MVATTQTELETSERLLDRVSHPAPLEVQFVPRKGSTVPSLFMPALLHHVLAAAQADGSDVQAQLPHWEALTPDLDIAAGVTERMVLLQADKVIGKGSRFLGLDDRQEYERAVGHRLSMNAVRPANRDSREAGSIFDAPFEGVQLHIRNTFARLGLRLPPLKDDPISPLIATFLKEALDNARIHGRDSVESGLPLPGYQFLICRRLTSDNAVGSESFAPALREWSAGVVELAKARGAHALDLIEVVVADSGDGIPATMKESLAIYREPAMVEKLQISKALSPGSTRPSNRPNVAPSKKKGQGFNQMLGALRDLRGVFLLWSGRTRLSWSTIDDSGRRKTDPFGDGGTTLLSREWNPEETHRVPGTSLAFAFPVNPSEPGQVDALFDP